MDTFREKGEITWNEVVMAKKPMGKYNFLKVSYFLFFLYKAIIIS
jgi:hypothetical protein